MLVTHVDRLEIAKKFSRIILAYPWSALKYSEVRMKYGIFAFFP
jgi:hypothetical protein